MSFDRESTSQGSKQQSPKIINAKEGTAGFLSSSTNLLKAIMGSGMLALPFAFGSVGALPGVLLLVVAAALSGAGLQLLVMASNRVTSMGLGPHRASNFTALAQPTYPKAAFIFEFAVLLKCTLVAASYLTVVSDVMPTFVRAIAPSAWSLLTSRYFWASFTAAIISPVCFMHRMDSLKYTSFLGLIGILYLFILSIILFFSFNGSVGQSLSNINLFVPFKFSSLTSFSVFVFAFNCHQNIFPIYNEIKDNRSSRLLWLISICLGICSIIYTIFALSFYGVFGAGVASNVLKSLPPKGAPYVAAQLLYGLLMIFSYPLQTFPARASLIKLVALFYAPKSNRMQLSLHMAATSVLIGITWIIVMTRVPLEFLLAFVGCTAGPVICYFLPALFWWRLESDQPFHRKGKLVSLSLFIFGIAAVIIPMTALILKTAKVAQ